MTKTNKSTRYLFICAYAQSRSKYFAESMMQKGYMSMFCGFEDEADFKLTTKYIEWADVIVLLSDEFKHSPYQKAIFKHFKVSYNTKHFKDWFIEDRPETFKKEFASFFKQEVSTHK